MKIVELYITDEEDSGVSELSLVAEPATHYEWLVFNNKCDGECQIVDHSHRQGEDFSYYLTHSPKITIETPSEEEYQKFFRPVSSADQLSNSEDNAERLVRYFYAVDVGLGPKLIKESRQVCRQLIGANKVYRNEDLVAMSSQLTSEDSQGRMVPRTKGFPVDLKTWKAGKQCRHIFKKLIIEVPENMTAAEFAGSVPKNANRAFGLKPNQIQLQTGPGGISNRKGYLAGRAGFSEEENFSPLGFIEGLIVYPSLKSLIYNEAEITGYSMILFDGVAGFIGGMADDEYFDSEVMVLHTGQIEEEFYTDYPTGAREAAAMGIKRNEELGNPCGTLVGKNRAQQIASGENLSEETILRTYSYLSRARKGFEEARQKGDYEACAYISYLLWGGLPMLSYVTRIVEDIQEEMMQTFGCVANLIAEGYGELEARAKCCKSCGSTGRRVYDHPTDNNEYNIDTDYVEDREMVDGIIELLIEIDDIEERKKVAYEAIETLTGEGVSFDLQDFINRLGLTGQMEFAYKPQNFADELKYEMTTVVMEPMRYIPRRNEMTGEIYYVVFSEETIKQMAQKFFKDGNQKAFNVEHSDKKLYGGYVYESWLVTDPENDKSKAMGFEVNKGTWMMTAKWDDKKEFEEYVLNGKTMGISLEGGFLSRQYNEENFSVIGEMDGEPIYSTLEEALERAEEIGCSGYHRHGDGYMACESHDITIKASSGLYNSDYDVFIEEVRSLINKN